MTRHGHMLLSSLHLFLDRASPCFRKFYIIM
jgi:hypothetical protein